jgi:hypothetical protein
VLRVQACDDPLPLSQHYAGCAGGPSSGRPFGLELGCFALESETLQLPDADCAAARSQLLDYFHHSHKLYRGREVFRFERADGLKWGAEPGEERAAAAAAAAGGGGQQAAAAAVQSMAQFVTGDRGSGGTRALLEQLCVGGGFDDARSQLGRALTGECAELLDAFPELGHLRDIAFYFKLLQAPARERLPEARAWSAADARLSWRYEPGSAGGLMEKPALRRLVVSGFGRDELLPEALPDGAVAAAAGEGGGGGGGAHAGEGFLSRVAQAAKGLVGCGAESLTARAPPR